MGGEGHPAAERLRLLPATWTEVKVGLCPAVLPSLPLPDSALWLSLTAVPGCWNVWLNLGISWAFRDWPRPGWPGSSALRYVPPPAAVALTLTWGSEVPRTVKPSS